MWYRVALSPFCYKTLEEYPPLTQHLRASCPLYVALSTLCCNSSSIKIITPPITINQQYICKFLLNERNVKKCKPSQHVIHKLVEGQMLPSEAKNSGKKVASHDLPWTPFKNPRKLRCSRWHDKENHVLLYLKGLCCLGFESTKHRSGNGAFTYYISSAAVRFLRTLLHACACTCKHTDMHTNARMLIRNISNKD